MYVLILLHMCLHTIIYIHICPHTTTNVSPFYYIQVILKEKCLKEEEDKIKGEIDIMKKVKHPNCIAFHEMYESKEKLYIVMELVTGALLLLYYILYYILREAPQRHRLSRDVRVEREALYCHGELETSALLLPYCCFTASLLHTLLHHNCIALHEMYESK